MTTILELRSDQIIEEPDVGFFRGVLNGLVISVVLWAVLFKMLGWW